MKDIRTRADIEQLVAEFYQEAMEDETIGHFFNTVVALDLEHHLPLICDFWETVLLGNIRYRGNPMLKHLDLAQKTDFEKKHFDRWLKLWESSNKRLFQGPVSEEALRRAHQIAGLMMLKLGIAPKA